MEAKIKMKQIDAALLQKMLIGGAKSCLLYTSQHIVWNDTSTDPVRLMDVQPLINEK